MFLFLLLTFSKVMARVKTISMHGYPIPYEITEATKEPILSTQHSIYQHHDQAHSQTLFFKKKF